VTMNRVQIRSILAATLIAASFFPALVSAQPLAVLWLRDENS